MRTARGRPTGRSSDSAIRSVTSDSKAYRTKVRSTPRTGSPRDGVSVNGRRHGRRLPPRRAKSTDAPEADQFDVCAPLGTAWGRICSAPGAARDRTVDNMWADPELSAKSQVIPVGDPVDKTVGVSRSGLLFGVSRRPRKRSPGALGLSLGDARTSGPQPYGHRSSATSGASPRVARSPRTRQGRGRDPEEPRPRPCDGV